MKILIACDVPNVDSEISVRFGRSSWFALFTSDCGLEFIQNPFIGLEDGVAKELSHWLVSHDVQKVIAGEFGEKMEAQLRKVSIQMIIFSKERNLGQLIELLEQTYKNK